jgi:hypothetical protein
VTGAEVESGKLVISLPCLCELGSNNCSGFR